MGLYLIGDFIVDLKNKYDYIQNQCAEYEYKGTDSADFVVEVNDKDLEAERKNSDIEYSNGYLESICAYRKLCLDIPSRDAMLLHGSVISCNGRGIAFLARSGVGKTTHTKLWKTVYKDKVEIINGDKPIIRFHQGIPFAYGTPWAGKEGFQTNSKVELTDICFIERSQENITQKINSVCCFDAFLC